MSLLVVVPSNSLIMQYNGLRRWGYNVKIIASRHEDIGRKHILVCYTKELQQQICKHVVNNKHYNLRLSLPSLVAPLRYWSMINDCISSYIQWIRYWSLSNPHNTNSLCSWSHASSPYTWKLCLLLNSTSSRLTLKLLLDNSRQWL